jgi:pimeloyl-ACP methyl ester carboxylesterase
MKIVLSWLLVAGVMLAPQGSRADSGDKPRIVLVHGAFVDGSSWQAVIPLLEQRGYPVIAVQNPLSSLADDVATTKRVIDAESALGPVIVVGHSYGGVVITAAAADNPQVKALVYVDAFAPEPGELLGDLSTHFGPTELSSALVPDAAGFLYVDRAKFQALFAADLPEQSVRVLEATQKPTHNSVFASAVDRAAWSDVPSFYLIGLQDHAIAPELQRFMAERIGAEIAEIDSSHVSLASHPRAVVRLIEKAARATSP